MTGESSHHGSHHGPPQIIVTGPQRTQTQTETVYNTETQTETVVHHRLVPVVRNHYEHAQNPAILGIVAGLGVVIMALGIRKVVKGWRYE